MSEEDELYITASNGFCSYCDQRGYPDCRCDWDDQEMDDFDLGELQDFDCGMIPEEGICLKAGTEECDFECPHSR